MWDMSAQAYCTQEWSNQDKSPFIVQQGAAMVASMSDMSLREPNGVRTIRPKWRRM